MLTIGKGKKVKASLFLTKHHVMKTYCWSGGIAPCILVLSTRWRCVVNHWSSWKVPKALVWSMSVTGWQSLLYLLFWQLLHSL